MDFNAEFYLFDLDMKQFVSNTTIEAGEQKLVVFCAPDMNPINFKDGVTLTRFDFLCDNEKYWISTPANNYGKEMSECVYIEHISE